ncbi:hypothetical protein AHAS_Ahas02G0020800 [Arachis hypogaea]
MAEALLSGFINVVLERLISREFVNLVVGKKLDRKLVDRLKTAILAAKALAADAEQKQFGNELVREWLDSLKDALYTADDLLDRVFIKAQIRSKTRIHRPGFLDLFSELGEKKERSILTRHLLFDRSIQLTKLPGSLGELINLRYLHLSGSAVETLPESLCNLCNLQTLKLAGCSKLTILPNDMYKLMNLRHLDIWGTPLKEMPKGMGKLKQLHTLSKFVVGKQEDNVIQELGGLLNLHGSLTIQKLENVVDGNEARRARIIDKKHVDEVLLEWSLSSGDDMVSNTHTDEQDILGGLQPHTGLKKLSVCGYKGKIFPDWMGHSLYQNMTSVSLQYCWNCCVLPSLGQLPSLKSLSIHGFRQLKRIGKEFYKNEGDQHSSPIAPFPSLERMQFHDMPCWEESPEGGLPTNLKELRVGGCEEQVRGVSWLGNLDNLTHLFINGFGCKSIKSYPEVGSLPRLPSLTTLEIRSFHNLETLECNELLRLTSLQELHNSLCHKLENIAGEKLPPSLLLLQIDNCHLLGKHCKNKHQQIWSKISHIPTIQVDDDQIF